MKKLLSLAALALISAAPLSAQSLDGAWITEFDRQIRNEGGSVSTTDKAKAKMVLKQTGDSVTGTWEIMDAQYTAPPRQLKGTINGNKATLQAEFTATVNVNGEREQRTITMLYEFTVAGDKLEGTMKNKSATMEMPARPFTAIRAKS